MTTSVDTSESQYCYLSPNKGKYRCKVEDGVMKFLCSSVADPEIDGFTFNHILDVKNLNGDSIKKQPGFLSWALGWGEGVNDNEQYGESGDEGYNDESEDN